MGPYLDMTIYFQSDRDQPYGCFSTHSSHGFQLDQRWWATCEHYFQAQKFAGTRHVEAIRHAKTAQQAVTLGRDRARLLRADWDAIKEAVMYRAVRCKFATHNDIRTLLLSTGEELLVANLTNDYYWGSGFDGSGQNRLGQILMTLRTQLRAELEA